MKHLKCLSCGSTFGTHKDQLLYSCPSCGGILDVVYDYTKLNLGVLNKQLKQKTDSLWNYSQILPIESSDDIDPLGEGGTPLIGSEKLSKTIGIKSLYIKNETLNPSGSFKDRPIVVALKKGKELGFNTAVTASSGNAGSSLATYSAFLDIPSLILVPETTSVEKIVQMQLSNAFLVKVLGHYSKCFKLAKEISFERKWMNVTSTYLNPFATEGNKTVAYEIYQQLGQKVPNWILIPVGSGPLLYGCYKGFKELKNFGFISKLPRMVGVQAEGCAPIAKAFQGGAEMVRPWGMPDTIASSIADPLQGYSQDGTQTLKTIQESDGVAVMVADQKILESTRILMEKTGIFAEPTAAISLAGVTKLRKEGTIKEGDSAVCVVTGSGYKDIESYKGVVDEAPKINPNRTELLEIINSQGSKIITGG